MKTYASLKASAESTVLDFNKLFRSQSREEKLALLNEWLILLVHAYRNELDDSGHIAECEEILRDLDPRTRMQ